jgi:hypothetical protein
VIRGFLANAPFGAAAFWSAIAAAVVSLAQFVDGEAFTYRAAHGGSASSVRDMFVTLNDLDTVKIVFLAGMIGFTGMAVRRGVQLPGWFGIYSLVVAPLLAISGFAFPFNNSALLASLDVTLILLLVWVGMFSTLVARRAEVADQVEAQPVAPLA